MLFRLAGGPEAGQLHSHGPWDGRGALGWSSGSVWRHPVLPPHPAGTPTSALSVGPYRRPEVRRRASCTHTAHGTVGGPLVGAPSAFGATRFRRPTLPGRPLRPSASAHTAGQGSGGGPAALTRPMGRSGGPWLGFRRRPSSTCSTAAAAASGPPPFLRRRFGAPRERICGWKHLVQGAEACRSGACPLASARAQL